MTLNFLVLLLRSRVEICVAELLTFYVILQAKFSCNASHVSPADVVNA
jgi:hypothetical protein